MSLNVKPTPPALTQIVAIRLPIDVYNRFRAQADRQQQDVAAYILEWARSGLVADEGDDKGRPR